MVDNKVIFDNYWSFKMRINENMNSGHFFQGFKISHTTPILLFIALSCFIKAFHLVVPKYIRSQMGFKICCHEIISVDEDLPKFFQTIKLHQADQIIKEYYHMRDRYGIEIEDADVIRKLEKVRIQDKTIQGTPWYYILSDLDYVERFNYVSAMMKDRSAYIKDINNDKNVQSDFVVLLLNLSFIPDEVIF